MATAKNGTVDVSEKTDQGANVKQPKELLDFSGAVTIAQWHVDAGAKTGSTILNSLHDALNIGSNLTSAVLSAGMEYQKKLSELNAGWMTQLQGSLKDTAEKLPDLKTADAAHIKDTCAQAISEFEKLREVNKRLAENIFAANMSAIEGLAALPRHLL